MPLHSEEVQEIMGRIPGWILRWGLTLIFGIMALLLIGSYFFKYPEVVSCPVVITTVNSPLELYAGIGGRIERICVKENERVEKGTLVAVINSTADYRQVLQLGQELRRLEGVTRWDCVVRQQELLPELEVGELQSGYIRFCKDWINFRHYLQQGYLKTKIALLEQQIVRRRNYYRNLCTQRELQEQDYQLAYRQYQRDSAFSRKYTDAVSRTEDEKQTQAFLQKKTAWLNFCASVENTEADILKLDEGRIDLEIQLEKELTEYRLSLDESCRLLSEAYKQWKEKYIVESSIAGQVTFTGYWNENQVVKAGDRLATVVPEEQTEIIGRAMVDMNGIGKVESGQKVNIKLNGFPYMEHGMLRGKVRSVSLVPEEEGYIAEIVLTGGMHTSYSKSLKFIQEMEGTAEIITKDTRLLDYFLNPLRAAITQ